MVHGPTAQIAAARHHFRQHLGSDATDGLLTICLRIANGLLTLPFASQGKD